MKFSTSLVALCASWSLALTIPAPDLPTDVQFRAPKEELLTLELAPGQTKQVTEAEKWALVAKGVHFMDITDYADLHEFSQNRMSIQATVWPASMTQSTAVKALLPKLNKTNIQTDLETFSAYYNRYYRSATGKSSSEWLLSRVQAVIRDSGSTKASARAFTHTSWTQNSIIATIPGKSSNTIVLGAHLDSVGSTPTGRAPGADDDGSGTMTILEAMRVLLTDPLVASGQAANTIEFHWYAAEEGGLLGSQAIFTNYKNSGKVVKAMLQQDMTGYVKPGVKEVVGVVTDYVDAGMTTYVKKVITAYCAIPYVETKCGYACSDHGSASKAGYPSSFVFESAFENSSPYIHSSSDTLSTVNYNHMIEHAKLTVGLAYELGFATGL
ncbi:leucine aminopeptidase 1 [Westerdykella ornata]|uniref:Peptide hydrolase n=1 Tax=Westerdykella ornata TaxID=318751 RepID=A0A6A6JPW2_WESOR|nr:leucine aminopeptidase 1 [Westerdykella ornata]KAF2278690.1 leucine aminopeptidase 1 [Westerdykella ornata]